MSRPPLEPDDGPSGGVPPITDEAFFALYEIDGPLGEGGFSAVVQAHRTFGDRESVALKMAKKEGQPFLEGHWAIDEEVRVWRMARHPNVVALYGVHNLPDYVVLTTELCQGGCLTDRLAKASDFVAESQAQRLAAQVVSAVLYLHSIGVCHRDVKPSNVLCSANAIDKMSVKVADFGFSTTFKPGEAAFTSVVGTTEYMAPELVRAMIARRQAAKGKAAPEPYDETVDLWATGCLIYELLAGKPPFYSVAERKQQKLILEAELEFPELAFDGVSDDAIELIRLLLSRDPAERPGGTELAAHPWIAPRRRSMLEALAVEILPCGARTGRRSSVPISRSRMSGRVSGRGSVGERRSLTDMRSGKLSARRAEDAKLVGEARRAHNHWHAAHDAVVFQRPSPEVQRRSEERRRRSRSVCEACLGCVHAPRANLSLLLESARLSSSRRDGTPRDS